MPSNTDTAAAVNVLRRAQKDVLRDVEEAKKRLQDMQAQVQAQQDEVTRLETLAAGYVHSITLLIA